jgi:hypothetical protein
MSKDANAKLHSLVAPARSTLSTAADNALSTTPERVVGSSTPCLQVVIKSLSSNAVNIRVGDSLISTTRGYQLAPGEGIALAVPDAYEVWACSESGTPLIAVLVATAVAE